MSTEELKPESLRVIHALEDLRPKLRVDQWHSAAETISDAIQLISSLSQTAIAQSKPTGIELADHDEIGRLVSNQPWEVQKQIVTIAAHCLALVDGESGVDDIAGCISQCCLDLAKALPASPPSGAPGVRYAPAEPLERFVHGPDFTLNKVYPVVEHGNGWLRVIALASTEERQAQIIAALSVSPHDSALIDGLKAAIRAVKLALFVIRKQDVMPNSSWQSGFDKDLATAESALAGHSQEENATLDEIRGSYLHGRAEAIEECANLALALDSGRGNEKEIAKAISALDLRAKR